MKNEMPLLEYGKEQLSPYMSMETIDFHYGKHLQTYVNNVQQMVAGTPQAGMSLEELIRTQPDGPLFNNAAQVMNHTLFFTQLCPPQKALKAPVGNMAKAVEQSFGSFEQMKTQLTAAAVGLFGSGWAWLSLTPHGKLEIKAMSNAGNPLREGSCRCFALTCGNMPTTLTIATGGPNMLTCSGILLTGLWWRNVTTWLCKACCRNVLP